MKRHGPTLVIRIELDDSVARLGTSCLKTAEEIVKEGSILDAKWSRPADQWREKGGGWCSHDEVKTAERMAKAMEQLHDDLAVALAPRNWVVATALKPTANSVTPPGQTDDHA